MTLWRAVLSLAVVLGSVLLAAGGQAQGTGTAADAPSQSAPLSPPLPANLPPEVRQAIAAGALGQLPADTGHAGPAIQPREALAPQSATPLRPLQPAPLTAQPERPGAQGTTPPSPTEELYRQRYASELAAGLRQFGYDLFGNVTAGPRREAPGQGYLLGPGDMLTVRFAGTGLDRRLSLGVDADGRLDLPGMGQVSVAGRTPQAAEQAVRELASRYVAGVEVSLAVETLREMQVYVVGEVQRPGLVPVPALSTALGALSRAGGVTKGGSLRRIRLYREGQPPRDVDLYALLLSGDRRADPPLREADVVFVPRLGPTAAVAGAASGPAIFELRGESSVAELLTLAGGGLPQGLQARVHLRRFDPRGGFAIRDLDATDAQALRSTAVQNGDLLEVRFATSDWPEVVRLTGHVRTPETLRYQPGLKLSGLLHSVEQLQPGAITDFGLLRRYDAAQGRYGVQAFPLAKLLAGGYDVDLKAHDIVEVLSREAYGIREPVMLRGAVWKEGEFDFSPGLSLVALLAQAGGLKFGADPARIELSRKMVEDGQAVTRQQTLDLERDRDFALKPYDAVFVPGLKDATTFVSATVQGEVRYPGTYRIRPGQTVSELLRRAGGFTDQAYFYGARYLSPKARVIQQESLDRLVRELEMYADRTVAKEGQTAMDAEEAQGLREARAGLQHLLASLREVKAEGRVAVALTELDTFAGSPQDFALEDGDSLDIPRKPSFVSVVGSVYTPSSFLYRPEAEVADYLALSGGPTQQADTSHMYLLKANGEVAAMAQSGMGSRFGSLRPMPGDTLVVPEDFERVPYFRLFKGLADVLFKIATTAGIALAAIN